ncbi:MAG: DUF433 domain-containing protein [Thiobacillus sp.]|nr:DUF433 domain-containing protein [Thiobacillus sp.]
MSLVGVGLYTFGEASKLTKVPARDLHRWLDGYSYKSRESDTLFEIPPLWDTELTGEEVEGISFHDLLEVRFVAAFRKLGVSLQTIRCASQHARDIFNHPYPFTCRRFQTDGRTIFAEAIEVTGETQFLDLVRKQYAFKQVIEPSLYRGIEFDKDELARRWFPMGRSKAVVLDPAIAFGKPTITNVGVRTSTLYEAFLAERTKQSVAKQYEVPLSAVEAAILFEERLSA